MGRDIPRPRAGIGPGAARRSRRSTYRSAPPSASAAAATSPSGWSGPDAAVLARIEAEERAASASLPRVLLFGAGHVGKAIATALAPLPFDIQWIDERAEEFPPQMPGANVHPIVTSAPLDVIAEAPPGSCYLILTHCTRWISRSPKPSSAAATSPMPA